MSKIVRTPLILVVLVSMVFASFWQVFSVPNAKAQGVPAPDPSVGWQFKFKDASKSSVQALVNLQNQPQELNFSSKTSVEKAKITYAGRDPFASNFTLFYAFALDGLGTPAGTMTNPTCTVRNDPNGGSTSDSKFYLIVAQTGENSPYYQYGLGTYTPGTQTYVRFRDRGDITQWCRNDVSAVIKDFTNLINPAGYTLIKGATDITDVASYCTQMSTNWETLKTAFRNLLIPVPQSNSNWTNDSVMGQTKFAMSALVLPLVGVGTGIGYALFGVNATTETEARWLFNTTIDYNLTDSGKNAYSTIISLAKQIQTQATALSEQFGTTSWPSNCTKLKKFKWNKALEDNNNTFVTLGEFTTALDKATESFKKFTAAQDEVIGDAGNTCGNIGSAGFDLAKIFNMMFCSMAGFIHDTAGLAMSKARELLMSFVGVDKLKFPDVDPTIVGGGTDAGGTGGTGGTGGGTTPTDPPSGETFVFDKTLTFTPRDVCPAASITSVIAATPSTLYVNIWYGTNNTKIPARANTVTRTGTGYTANIVAGTALPSGTTRYTITMGIIGQFICQGDFTN